MYVPSAFCTAIFVVMAVASVAAWAAEPPQTMHITCVSDDGSISEDIVFAETDHLPMAMFVRRAIPDISPVITETNLEFVFDEEIEGTVVRTMYFINRSSGRYLQRFLLGRTGQELEEGTAHHGSCRLAEQRF